MKTPTLLILGGYGNAGKTISSLLLRETRAKIIISGRSREKAEALAGELNTIYKDNRAGFLAVDAWERSQLRDAFDKADIVLVASSTVRLTGQVAEEAIEAGIDYMDIQFSMEKVERLKKLKERIAAAGLCFVTDGGYHPGVPAVLIRYAASKMDLLHRAVVGAILNIDWSSYEFSQETIDEFVDELRQDTIRVFKKSAWREPAFAGMFETVRMDFEQYGKNYLFPMFLEEMRRIPEEYPELSDTGFYIGGINWFSDWFTFPLAMTWYRLFPSSNPGWLKTLVWYGMKNFSKPPYYTLIKLQCKGNKNGKPVSFEMLLSHEDGYLMTAIPVVACLKQIMQGPVRKPGLWTQGEIVEPDVFIRDVKRMGIGVSERFLE